MREVQDWDRLAEQWEHAALLASRLAHDLSNIFTGVNGFCELAEMQLPPDHPARHYLRDVLAAGQRGIELSQRLHLLRTCAVGQQAVSSVTTGYQLALDRLRGSLQPSLKLETQWPDDLPQVNIAIEPLQLILWQLLQNAIDATGPRGTIRVAAQVQDVGPEEAARLAGRVVPGRHVEITIADNGPGIPPELSNRLLKVPMTTTKPGSRGLGLAIVFRTLFHLGGGFELVGDVAGGATARVVLPVA